MRVCHLQPGTAEPDDTSLHDTLLRGTSFHDTLLRGTSLHDSMPERGYAVTIGAYDGVHLGHRSLIARVRAAADVLDCGAAVVTFDRHPAEIVRPESAPAILTDLDQKLELLASTGVDLTVVVHFDDVRAAESPEEFVSEVLVDLLHARAVVVGHDFHFGKGREGNVELLARMGGIYGFDVTGLRLVTAGAGGTAVSSTRVRAALADGHVEEAAALLGRDHQVRGVVVHGDERGRELGYPTANVAVPSVIAMPADGVYAGWFEGSDGTRRPSALSLGRRPTFYESAQLSLLEVHVLDFSGDLYDQAARVDFSSHLRGQRRFDSVDALVAQMGLDVAEARSLLT